MKLCLFGGTFDPIHIGHLILAEWTRVYLKLNKIIFIPSFIPPHKQNVTTPAQTRFEMVQLAIQDNPFFTTSDYEILKQDISYSVETICKIRHDYKLSSNEMYFLIGLDSLIDLPKWYKPDDILSNCQIVVYKRPNFSLKKVQKEYLKKVILLDAPEIDISSTCIRKRVSDEQSIKYMVPQIVEDFIAKNALYKKKS